MRRMRAFTLVELLVVITIIGILVSIAVPNYNKIRNKAKEQQVIAGGNAITVALESFAQSHNGLYPGVALPVCDNSGPNGDGTDQLFFNDSGAIGSTGNIEQLHTMRGLIGGGPIEPRKPVDYFDNFYFEPIADGTRPRALPDRLINDGVLDSYPMNPFIRNIPGVSDQGRPMVNIFGIEHEDPLGGGTAIEDVNAISRILNLSHPIVQGAAPGSYGFQDPNRDPWPIPAGTAFPASSQVVGIGNLRFDRNNNFRVDRGEVGSSFVFPEGDFAYIPLDPIQRNSGAQDFMRFTKNYWLVVYGTKDTALSNKYENVMPNFKPPLGDGRAVDPNLPFFDQIAALSPYEYMAKRALVGAVKVYASAYEDQLNVASDQ